jgi:hypothetical protein
MSYIGFFYSRKHLQQEKIFYWYYQVGDENISGRQNMQFSKQFSNNSQQFSSRVGIICVTVWKFNGLVWILRSINSWGLLWDINKLLLLTCLLVGCHWLGIPISNPKNLGSSYQQPNLCWDV